MEIIVLQENIVLWIILLSILTGANLAFFFGWVFISFGHWMTHKHTITMHKRIEDLLEAWWKFYEFPNIRKKDEEDKNK